MWPWGHLAVGYLVYTGVLDRRFRRPPGDLATLTLALATQLPDLLDKPLAWNLGVIPNGRSLAHSLLFATLLVALVGITLYHRNQPAAALAFGVGYLSHLATDALYPFVEGQWDELAFLGWPVLSPVEYTGPRSIIQRFVSLFHDLAAGELPGLLAFEFLLLLLAIALWFAHDFPGIGIVDPRRESDRIASSERRRPD